MPDIAINFSKSAFTVTGPSDLLSKTTRTGEYNEKATPGTEETLDTEATPAMTTLTFKNKAGFVDFRTLKDEALSFKITSDVKKNDVLSGYAPNVGDYSGFYLPKGASTSIAISDDGNIKDYVPSTATQWSFGFLTHYSAASKTHKVDLNGDGQPDVYVYKY